MRKVPADLLTDDVMLQKNKGLLSVDERSRGAHLSM
jgi:hypothetical protein